MEYKLIPGGLDLLAFGHQFTVSAQVEQALDRTVYGLGVSSTYTIRDNPIRRYNFAVSGTIQQMYSLFLSFVDRQARAKLLYFQAPEYSLTLSAQATSGDDTLVFDQDINLQSPLDCLVAEWDNNYLCYPISSAAGKEITLQAALPVDIPTYASIGYAFRARFDQDEIEFKHPGGDICTTDIAIIEVLQTPREVGT